MDCAALGDSAASVADLDAWRKRAEEQELHVVAEPAAAHGFRSFFLRGPDNVLIELVQASPLPALCPKSKP